MEFSNPVLPGMYPDPTVCRVGRDYYLACSSCEYFPGVPIFHSCDLVNWRQLGHVLTRKSQLDLTGTRSSGGIYAPTLRHHEGTFYLIATHIDRGNFVVTATHPGGPWSDPAWLDPEGIDPSLAFLEGHVYYTRTGPGTDFDHPFTYQTELEWSDGRPRLARKPQVIWKGTGGVWPEGPHLYRRGNYYYLLTAEGGTSFDHSVVVARSKRPYGPFTPSPHGPLLTHRDRPCHPIQAAGHADWVELEDGSTWAVLLGIRPSTGRNHHLGRETFLTPVNWGTDDWPRMGPLELSMEGPANQTPSPASACERDDFDSRKLARSWVFVRNPSARDWSLRQRPGYLRLSGSSASLRDVGSPAFVCRRQQDFDVTARTQVEFEPRQPGDEAGLCIRANEEFHYTLLIGLGEHGRELRLAQTLRGRSSVVERLGLGEGPVTLAITATARDYTFWGGTGGELQTLGSLPTKVLSAESILKSTGRHHFTGNMIGLLATGNGHRSTAPADFRWFEYAADR